MGGTGVMSKALKRRIDKGRRGAVPDDMAAPAEPAATPASTKPGGRGYRFIAVRGIFPLRDQMAELARVMGLPSTQRGAARLRAESMTSSSSQTRIGASGADPWSGPWEPVDREPVVQLLENDVNGYAPETVLDGLIDPHICMPYPERIVGDWDRLATHPDIKEFTLSDDEVDKQVEFEWRLIERAKKEESKTQKPVDKGGFSALTKNMRPLANRSQATGGVDERSLREKVLAELEHGNGDKEQLNEQLAEFVRKSATAVDHYLLFRYLDIGDKDRIKPGATYRYRVKLVSPIRSRPAACGRGDRSVDYRKRGTGDPDGASRRHPSPCRRTLSSSSCASTDARAARRFPSRTWIFSSGFPVPGRSSTKCYRSRSARSWEAANRTSMSCGRPRTSSTRKAFSFRPMTHR